jgi:signal transduction histidine kinase
LGVRLDQIGRAMIWGEVSPEYLWQGPLVSGGLELAVFGEHNEMLFATLEPGEAEGMSTRMRQLAGDRFFDFEYAGEEYVAARRRCLLKRRFGTYWEVAVARRRDLWYAEIVPIRNRSILLGCLATLLVVLVTSEQMRRTLVPLQSIRQGIEAVEEQRYDEPVDLHSGDEFEELGNAFNRMTYRLAAITADRDRYEANLVESRDRAIKTARLESEFLANVSHELRTPMTSIRSFAEILREYADEDREHRQEFLDIIVSESERLTRLIEQILSFSKVQSGAEPWSFQLLDVRDSVRGMCQGLAPVAAEGKVIVHTDFQEDLPKTAGDDHGLRQVWINLVSNAIKFSEPGQEVTVRVHADRGSIIVEVEDHGPGIDPDDHQVIFGRFRQACSDFLTDKPRGTGLGLTIAEAIVRRHRGKIEVDSTLGEGSTFRVILPIVDVDSLLTYEDLTELERAING